jgi:hypothetical protein
MSTLHSFEMRSECRVSIMCPERLAKAKSIGVGPIDFGREDPVATIVRLEPNGVENS